MGSADRPGTHGVQRGQGISERVRPHHEGTRALRWRKRVLRASLLCLLILVLSLAYAIATGRPIPETASRLLGIFVQVLLGGM